LPLFFSKFPLFPHALKQAPYCEEKLNSQLFAGLTLTPLCSKINPVIYFLGIMFNRGKTLGSVYRHRSGKL